MRELNPYILFHTVSVYVLFFTITLSCHATHTCQCFNRVSLSSYLIWSNVISCLEEGRLRGFAYVCVCERERERERMLIHILGAI